MHPHDTIVNIGGKVAVGSTRFVVIAGPCAVESREQLFSTAESVKSGGASCLRGGAFKPRTSPYAFQGLGVEGLEILAEASRLTGLPSVTEIIDVHDVGTVAEYADALQVGARNMQNFRLLQELGRCKKPVILKRGMAAGITDLLLAAEYIMAEGNPDVILCERGIKTFETATRNTLDLGAVPYIKARCHLPVIVDPSHGTGIRELVSPMARAAAACGADGVMVEVHVNPTEALSDGAQSLFPAEFEAMMRGLKPFAEAAGRTL
jgi:3-deoxy-7-phosphoheptulonate synthase